MILITKRNEIDIIIRIFWYDLRAILSVIIFITIITNILLKGNKDNANHFPQVFTFVSLTEILERKLLNKKYRIRLKTTPISKWLSTLFWTGIL